MTDSPIPPPGPNAESWTDEPPTVEGGPEYDVDFRERPERYRVGRGEQGAFKVEPYKSELLPSWGYADSETAEEAVTALLERFEAYRSADDFVGMDMARKYVQMGYTRAMRYARYPGGRKYDDDGDERDPEEWADEEKRAAAEVFAEALRTIESDERYTERRREWRERYG